MIPLFANEEAAGGRLIAPQLAAGLLATELIPSLNVPPGLKHSSVLPTERFGERSVYRPERAASLAQILRRLKMPNRVCHLSIGEAKRFQGLMIRGLHSA